MQPVSKEVREFVRAADLLLQQINEKGHFNDFEKLLLTSYATRLHAANTLLQSIAVQREAQALCQRDKAPGAQPVFTDTAGPSEPMPRTPDGPFSD